MKKSFYFTRAALAALTLKVAAATLPVGEAAPELKVSKWVKGEAVSGLDSNRTYVVKFWATRCNRAARAFRISRKWRTRSPM